MIKNYFKALLLIIKAKIIMVRVDWLQRKAKKLWTKGQIGRAIDVSREGVELINKVRSYANDIEQLIKAMEAA
jgi:hypothetical protein